MKGVVVYDTHYGNTRTVAEAIAAELEAEGHEADLRSVRERHPSSPRGDILFLGSPVRFGSVSGRVKRYAKAIDTDVWKDKPIVVFTTTLLPPGNPDDAQMRSEDRCDLGAGLKLRDLARSMGLDALEDPLWVEVTGMKGPLIATGVEKTRRFTHDVLLAQGLTTV